MKKKKVNKEKLKKQNIIVSVALCIVMLILYLYIYSHIGGIISDIFNIKYLYTLELIVYIIMAALLIIVVLLIRKKEIFKFELKPFLRGFFIAGFFSFLIALNLIDSIKEGIKSANELEPIGRIIIFTMSTIIGIGFTEEVLCRGIIQNVLYDAFGRNTKKGVYLSIIFTSIMFGSAHFLNYFTTGAGFEGVLTQVLSATVMGLYLGAIYARSRSLWSVIFIHGLLDFSIMITEGYWGIGNVTEIISSYELKTVIYPVILYTSLFLFLLRKKKINECFDNKKTSK